MSGNLFLQDTATDTGTRPLPANSTFWLSPAVALATPDGNYTDGQATTIDVQVSLKSSAAYEFINVEVWVCDPTTNPTPTTALFPVQPTPTNPNPPRTLGPAFYAPPPNSGAISTVPVIPVTGFLPYSGISSLPGGHCCLIANCWGTTVDGVTEWSDLAGSSANFNNLVQTDQHVAQHNIFADPTPPGPQMKVINFPFHAASPLTKGAEQVRLEIVKKPPAQLQTMLHQGLPPFRGAKFKGLQLEASERPVKHFGLTGRHKEGRDKEGHEVELELEAHESRLLTATVELDRAERPGAAHAFDVVQRDAHGRTQGGLTLVTYVSD